MDGVACQGASQGNEEVYMDDRKIDYSITLSLAPGGLHTSRDSSWLMVPVALPYSIRTYVQNTSEINYNLNNTFFARTLTMICELVSQFLVASNATDSSKNNNKTLEHSLPYVWCS